MKRQINPQFRLATCIAAILLLSALFTNLPASDEATFPFQSNVFITDWLVCGPFPNEKGQTIDTDFLAERGGETKLTPALGMQHKSSSVPEGMVSWRLVKADLSGKLDFLQCMRPNQKNVAYAAATILCEKKTQAILKLGSNDRVKVWLNGELIHYYSSPRSSGPDADQIPVSLNQGSSLLLAKVDNEGANWHLYARMEELLSMDDRLFVLKPAVSQVPKRISATVLADLISVLAFNVSETAVGPISLEVHAAPGRKANKVIFPRLEPRQTTWLDVESEVDLAKAEKKIAVDVAVSSGSVSKIFHLEEERVPLTDGTVYLVPGFHVDPIWLQSQAGYQELTFSNLEQHLRAVEADSSFQVFLHEIPYLKPYYDSHPQERALIRRLVKEGRIATGGSYNQPNETTISGEALIRNILYGRLFHENVLGDYPRAYQPWDVFGHIIQLPQILTKSEFIGTGFTRSNYREPEVRVPDVPDAYWAVAPDGSKLLTRKVNYGFDWRGFSYNMPLSARQKAVGVLRNQQSQVPGLRYDLILDASDEKAPTAWMVGSSKVFKTFVPEVRLSAHGMAEYLAAVSEQAKRDNLDIPEVSRDESQYNEGCELSRFDLKMGNRLGENTLVTAEKFATIANALGADYPAAALDKAWRQLLFGQHHDGVTGCGSDIPYLDLVAGYHEAVELGARSLDHALEFIAEHANTQSRKGDLPLLVFNPLNWQRDDLVRAQLTFEKPLSGFAIMDDQGRPVECIVETTVGKPKAITSAQVTFLARQIPSLGYRTFWVRPTNALPPVAKQNTRVGNSIENAYYRLTLDEKLGGGISSLIDKASGQEFISIENGHPGNELILLKEGDGFEPAWRFLTTGEKFFSKDTRCEIAVQENPLFKRIVVTGEMPRMQKRVQEITLYNGLPRIDFRTYLVDYQGLRGQNILEKVKHDDRDFFCIGFPANLPGAVPVLEDRFATKTYYPSKEYLSYYSTAREWTSHHSMNSCYQWMDNSYSVRVNFGDKASIALGPCEILTPRNSALRQAGFRLQAALAKAGVTCTPSYDTVKRDYDIQYRRFSFSIGTKGGNQYNEKLLQGLSAADKVNFEQSLEKDGYAYLLVHDGKLVEAWFELPVLMIVGTDEKSTEAAVDKLVEQLTKANDINIPASAYVSPHKASVPQHGLAILNRGNIAVSTEPDGSMILSLMHIVPWQNPLLTWTHDFPERKTHVFDYALVPHAGNWRDADLVRRGYEFNNPLIPLQAKQSKGELPSSFSFFSTEGADAVITALKPKSQGNEAFLRHKSTEVSNGVILRLYECEGQGGSLTFRSSLPIRKAESVNLVERKPQPLPSDANSVQLPLTSNSIETLQLTLDQTVSKSNKQAAATAVAPIYGRYWEHNEGASPLGYLPVNVRILPNPDEPAERYNRRVIWQLKVAVCNDYVDSDVEGMVKIETPVGLRAVPAEINYQVPADSEQFYSVTVVAESENWSSGFVRASIEHGGQTIFDVLEFGLPEKAKEQAAIRQGQGTGLEWAIEQKQDKILVRIHNPYAQAVTGEVTLISPVETWGLLKVNPIALTEFLPWRQGFTIPANGNSALEFSSVAHGVLRSADVKEWAVAKLTYFGYVDYRVALGDLEIKK